MNKWLTSLFSRRSGKKSRGLRRPAVRNRFLFERLEDRLVRAVTMSVIDGELLLVSDGASDTVGVGHGWIGSTIEVVSVKINGQLEQRRGGIDRIRFVGNGGNDRFTNTSDFPADISGGDGNDVLIGGVNSDTISGGAGNDILDGGTSGPFMTAGQRMRFVNGTDVLEERVPQSSGGVIRLTEIDMTGTLGTDKVTGFEEAILRGGLGPDVLDASGFDGSVTLRGSSGNDVLTGGDNDDILFGDSGDDILNPSGGFDDYDGGTGSNSGLTVLRTGISRDDRDLDGRLHVSLRGDRLLVTGPTGYGFALAGDWTRSASTDPSGKTAESFFTSGIVTVEGALGISVPLFIPSLAPLRFNTRADRVDNFGAVSFYNMTGSAGLETSDPASPFHVFAEQFGLGINASNVSWGLRLGSDLPEGIPANPAIPYLFFSSNVAGPSASFGDFNASIGTSNGMTLTFDPADPSIFIKVNEFALGASLKGYIPFTPQERPALASAEIYGNLYGEASVDLGIYPFSLSGNAVIDLDANDDGSPLGLTGNNVARLLDGRLALDFVRDVAIGVNGTLSVGFTKAGVDFSFDAIKGSAMYSPGEFAFRGDQVNPFAGTPLAPIVASQTPFVFFEMEGVFRGTGFSVSASAHNIPIAQTSYKATTVTVQVGTGLGTSLASLDADIVGLLGTIKAHVHGSVEVSGNFLLKGTVGAAVDVGIGIMGAGLDVTLERSAGAVTLTIGLHGIFEISYDGLGIRGTADVTFSGRVTDKGVLSFSGTGKFQIDILVPSAPDISVDGGFNVSVDGFRISLPLVPDPVIRFGDMFNNSSSAFQERSITSPLCKGDVALLSGIVFDPDVKNSFFLTINWGDGTAPENYTFGPEFNGQLVTLGHQYTEKFKGREQTYNVTLTWTDRLGIVKEDTLTVVVEKGGRGCKPQKERRPKA